MAKSVPVIAIAVGLVLTGAVLFLRSGERTVEPAPAVAQVLPSGPDETRGGRPDLSGLERSERVRSATGAVVATPAQGAPKLAGDRLALPAVPASKAWSGLFKAADDLAAGTMTQEGVVNLAFDLLAQLPVDATPKVANGLATYDLLDSPGQGKVQLVVNLGASKDGAANPTQANAFAINAELETRPGAYTGNAADNAKSTHVDITLRSDEHDVLQGVMASSQNIVTGGQDLWTQMSGAAQSVVIGGTLEITGASGTWRPLTVEAAGTPDKPGFLHKIGEPIGTAGRLADPRTQLLNDVLTSRRKSIPR